MNTTTQWQAIDFHYELIPLRSPLLGESTFVSFPPLSDMLKFSGYALAQVKCEFYSDRAEMPTGRMANEADAAAIVHTL